MTKYIFKLRRDSAAGWAAENPVLAEGEPGVDLTDHSWKIGDGVTPWTDLPEATDALLAEAQALLDEMIDLSGLAVPDALVQALVDNTGGAGPLTSAALKRFIDRERRSGLAEFIPTPMHYENFARPDVADLNGLLSQSGHVYQSSYEVGSTARNAVVDGKLVPSNVAETGVLGAVLILYMLPQLRLKSIAGEFEFYGGETATTGNENAVLGTPKRSYGAGSIQLSVYAIERPDNPGIDWRVFCVPNPDVPGAYPTVAQGTLDMGPKDRTGRTKYRMAMHRTGTDQLTLQLPDGNTVIVDDALVDATTGLSLVNTYWGSKPGWQLRRNFSTDGFVRFTALATAAF